MANYFIGDIKPYIIVAKDYKGFQFRYKSATMKSYGRKIAVNKKIFSLLEKL